MLYTVKEAKQDGDFKLKAEDGEIRTVSYGDMTKLNPDDSPIATVPGGAAADENTLPLFRRTREGGDRRQRLVDGEATAEDWATMPEQFREIARGWKGTDTDGFFLSILIASHCHTCYELHTECIHRKNHYVTFATKQNL